MGLAGHPALDRVPDVYQSDDLPHGTLPFISHNTLSLSARLDSKFKNYSTCCLDQSASMKLAI
jgi:hypothetical protein